MIKNVNDFSLKSFEHFTGPPSESEFKKKNILFGYNGQGKSALSVGIMQEFLKDPNHTQESLRFFNKQYVDDNMILKPGDKSVIRGVKANFGAKNVSIEKEIEKLRESLHDTDKLDDEIDKLRKATREEIDKIHSQRKGKANINKKATGLRIAEVVELYEKDIAEAKRIEPDEDILSKIVGDNTFEVQKDLVDSVIIEPLGRISETDISLLDKLFTQTYADIDIPTSTVIKWLNEGLEIHDTGDTCKFCGGRLDYNVIKLRVQSYNENLKQRAVVELSSLQNKLQRISDQLGDLITRRDNITTSLGTGDISKEFEDLTEKRDSLDSQINVIDRKLNGMDSSAVPDLKTLRNFVYPIMAYQNIIESKKKRLELLSQRIQNQSTLVKGAIGFEVKKNTFIRKNIEDINQMVQTLQRWSEENNVAKQKIELLKNQKSTTIDFALHLNGILKNIGVSLQLEMEGDDYSIKHPERKIPLSLEDISEGEQNLLALLYFYYELFSDKAQKYFKNTIELVIIDDPISSIDGINRMYVLEMIKDIIELEEPQVFVFTHVWEDFCDLIHNRHDANDTPYRFYEIAKYGSESSLSTTKPKRTPYRHLFKEIYQFSQKPNSIQLTDCEIYHYPNVMRKILEGFLEFKLGSCSPTASNKEKIERVLLKENTTNNRMKTGMLLDVCNILSHRPAKCPVEIHKSARFLMNCIRDVDKQHFDSMIGE